MERLLCENLLVSELHLQLLDLPFQVASVHARQLDLQFLDLLEEARVAVVPGADFGSDRHVRLSYATSLEAIREGLARIERACAGLPA